MNIYSEKVIVRSNIPKSHAYVIIIPIMPPIAYKTLRILCTLLFSSR